MRVSGSALKSTILSTRHPTGRIGNDEQTRDRGTGLFRLGAPFVHLGVVMIALAGQIVAGNCAEPWKFEKADPGFGLELEGALRYGPIHGYLQTPSGGAPGTTSSQRPTFKELNIDDFLSPEASLDLRWRNHAFYGGASLVHLDGNSTLDSTLVSQGTTFPAGAAVKSVIDLDLYRLGYQYSFSWGTETGRRLTISPGAGVALLNFDYSLKAASGGLAAHRSYLVGGPQLGFSAEWTPPGRFSVAGGIFSSLPEVSNLFILSTQVTWGFRLWGHGERAGKIFLGVGYDWLDYEDNQPVPNHIKADFGPMLRFGINARF